MMNALPPIAIFANRLPDPKETAGGAVLVNMEARPKLFIGPKEVKNHLYDIMTPEEREGLPLESVILEGHNTHVVACPVRETEEKLRYGKWSNVILWIMHHGMKPSEFLGTISSAQAEAVRAKGLDNSNPYDLQMSMSEFRLAYQAYSGINEQLNLYQDRLRERGHLKDMLVSVQDYQMLGVKGDMFFLHIPFPDWNTWRRYTIGKNKFGHGESVPVVRTEEFLNYIEEYTKYPQIGFQSPTDMQNFIETLHHCSLIRQAQARGWSIDAIQPFGRQDAFYMQNRHLFQGETVKPMNIGEDGAEEIHYGERKFMTMSQPVGTCQKKNLKTALDNVGKLDQTAFSITTEKKEKYGKGEMDADQARICGIDLNPDGPTDLKYILSHRKNQDGTPLNLLSDPGHTIGVGWWRNDYTKCTLEVLGGFEKFCEQHPEEIGRTHLVLALEPSRLNVDGYASYAQQVMRKVDELRNTKGLGDSLIVIPAGVKNPDLMGLTRNRNAQGELTTGFGLAVSKGKEWEIVHPKTSATVTRRRNGEGHNLVIREMHDAFSDLVQKDSEVPVGIITSPTSGVSCVVAGSSNRPGAFIHKATDQREILIDEIKDSISNIITLRKTPEGRRELTERLRTGCEASAEYRGESFHRAMVDTFTNKAKPLRTMQAPDAIVQPAFASIRAIRHSGSPDHVISGK